MGGKESRFLLRKGCMFFSNNEEQNRFSIDAKLVGILSVVAFLGILLVFITILAANTLSSLRSYATIQTHWTEIRKEAASNLESYSITGNQRYLDSFQENIAILQRVEKARIELSADTIDPMKVVSALQVFKLKEGKIRDMVKMVDRFGDLPEFAEALHLWKVSDQKISQLDSLAAQIQNNKITESDNNIDREQWTEQINTIDNRLTDLQYELASVLELGSQRLENINLWASLGTGIILLLVGGFMSWRLLRSIHQWEHTLEMNIQRYQSLFDQNPNAVYSFTPEGRFIEGNEALENLLDTSLDQIKGVTFDQFVHPSEREKVRTYFEKAASGEPQTYEAVGLNTENEKIHVQITNLPIFVDGEIVGVYGIAQDIEERVQAEQQIEDQLEERTVLLEEIHHRVKNNLAFVSSMLMLNEEEIESDKARQQLKEAQNRIFAIADIHEIFYESDDFSKLSVEQYAEKILTRLSEMFASEEKSIKHKVEMDKIGLSINKAIPFGLILNELAVNSYKHAFQDKKEGVIKLSIRSQNGMVRVVYQDDGVGLSPDFNLEEVMQSSLGMRLIYTFLQQLGADYQLATGDDKFRLEFAFSV